MRTESNPNPELITEPMWKLWMYCPFEKASLSGIYANKKGYHNTVNANLKNWPGNYSIRFPLDLVSVNRNKARAIDLTMSEGDMIKWTTRMKNSALNYKDNRLAPVREFYGTLDGKTVYGLIKDSENGHWRRTLADDTHLWHGHMGVFTAFVNDWEKLQPILSVWAGISYEKWRTPVALPEVGDSGSEVGYYQYVHNLVRNTVSPPSPAVTIDSEYGPKMSAAVLDFWKKKGGQGDSFKGTYITAWVALQYQQALIKITGPQVTPNVDPELIVKAVNAWMEANSDKLSLSDASVTLEGKLTFHED